MGANEAGTLAPLKARRKEVLEPLVAKHQGRVFKVTGDGIFVEFGSAANAVQCAIDLQREMAAANADLPTARHIVRGSMVMASTFLSVLSVSRNPVTSWSPAPPSTTFGTRSTRGSRIVYRPHRGCRFTRLCS